MEPLNFPDCRHKVTQTNRGSQIFDPVRRKSVALTPEEWVRQHLIQFLHEHCGYPIGLLSIEKTIALNGMSKRYDLVAYRTDGTPGLIAECKAPAISIGQETFEQAARYNIVMRVRWLLITNGIHTVCAEVNHATGTIGFVKAIPLFQEF